MNMVPDWQAKLLENGKGANYGLYFSRMTTWRQHGGELKAEYLARVVQTKKGPKEEYAPDIERLGEKSQQLFLATSFVLEAIHTHQTALLKTEATRGGMVWEFRARLLSPFVSGLGSGHPTETGMILDRNSGLPYIPASAVKGVLRLACALHIAETEPDAVVPCEKEPGHLEIPDDHRTLRRYFGDTNTGKADSVRGQIVFLDAFPASRPSIKTDIMNPHFGKYYAGEQGPLETENPIPVKFLAVAPETEFVFRCFSSPLPERGPRVQAVDVVRPFDAEDEQAVIAMFTRAFDQLGFGGKTSIGYGRFTVIEKNTADHFQVLVAQDVEQRLQEETQRRQEEENRRYPWRPLLRDLAKITDWGMLRQKVLDNKAFLAHQTEVEVAQAVLAVALGMREANKKTWSNERDQQITEWLAPARMVWPIKADTLPKSLAEGATGSNRVVEAGLKDFSDWLGRSKTLGLGVDTLSLEETQSVLKLFKDWNLGNKKAWKKNPGKKKHWDAVQNRIQQLKTAK